MSGWYNKKICGVLLDITGVLYDSGPGGGTAIDGSIEAVKRLKASGIPLRFCTNETTTTRKRLEEKLTKLGFEINQSEIFPPIPAMCKILTQRGLRPHIIACSDALADFEGVDQADPNCVVIADSQEGFSYENLNKAFQLLMRLEAPKLFALGKGKYYKEAGNLVLDVGPYMKALEYACNIEAEVVGKPSATFFKTVIDDMGQAPEQEPLGINFGVPLVYTFQCVMVGDDIVGDVGGAQSAGMMGVQVRTGKFRPQDENHPSVKPDGFVNNLAEAVDLILAHRS